MQDTQTMFWKKFLGAFGEDTAVKFLIKQGYMILERNYKCRFGEIDIIAMDKSILVFVEVKTIATDKTETPGDTVNARKQNHIRNAAEFYLSSGKQKDFNCRFDVVAIKYIEGANPKVELIKDAF